MYQTNLIPTFHFDCVPNVAPEGPKLVDVVVRCSCFLMSLLLMSMLEHTERNLHPIVARQSTWAGQA